MEIIRPITTSDDALDATINDVNVCILIGVTGKKDSDNGKKQGE
jgi:hypothetical protein